MNLAGAVIRHLEERGVPSALIGGLALAAHGIPRATLDSDVLVTDPVVLRGDFWAGVYPATTVTIRRGDTDDPLAGVVRLNDPTESVDIIVGKEAWQRGAIDRRSIITLEGERLPLVGRGDLILLKLFAAGPQDLLDVRLLYEADPDGITTEVERLLAAVPPELRAAWQRISTPPAR